jgi:two-component system phosphate regulon response regulator PhoB
MQQARILIIEDEKDIAELVDYNLRQSSLTTDLAFTGIDGLSKARRNPPDLIILDIMLPGMNGLDVCKALKGDPKTQGIPIILLTAKGEEMDRVVGFEVGADDYLTKPFSPRELILRVKAILRRFQSQATELSSKTPLTYHVIHMDPSKFEVLVNKKEVKLTAIEFKLLYHLILTKGRVATRDSLLDQVWGYESALTTRTVDTHVKRLRAKLGKAGEYIETIRGIGYKIKDS